MHIYIFFPQKSPNGTQSVGADGDGIDGVKFGPNYQIPPRFQKRLQHGHTATVSQKLTNTGQDQFKWHMAFSTVNSPFPKNLEPKQIEHCLVDPSLSYL